MLTSRRVRGLLIAVCTGVMLAAASVFLLQQAASAQSTPLPIPRLWVPIAARSRITPTPRPIPTPPPAPVTQCTAAQPTFLPSWNVYQREFGSPWIVGVGVLCNPLNRAIYIDYSFDAVDGQGNIIESISDTSWHSVPAGGVMCVENTFYTRPANSARYQFRVRGWSYASQYFKYGGTVVSANYDYASHTVSGSIQNFASENVYVGGAVALYDGRSQILMCDELPTINDTSLVPNQITSFSSKFYDYDPAMERILQQATQYQVMLSRAP